MAKAAAAKGKKTGLSLNITLLFGALSVLLCWFYGLPPLALGIIALRNANRFRQNKKESNGPAAAKRKWAFNLAIIGTAFSAVFSLYYIVALFTGAFISYF